jgi:diacylglycerol kinase (ATP)
MAKGSLKMANNVTGLVRIIKAAGYSWKGLRAAWQHEAAFRQEAVLALVAIIIACWLDIDAMTRVMLIGSVVLIIIVEILNSAIEAVVDRIGNEFHPLAGRAKDMGSAAVLISIILALFVWVTLLWSYLR